MRARSIFLCLCVLILVTTISAAAPTRHIHEIQSPLFNAPAIVKSGDAFSVKFFLPPDTTPKSIKLIPTAAGGKEIDLPVGARIHSGLFDSFLVMTPADAPEGLYNLQVTFSNAATDTQPHAVKVVSEFKSEYVFVHLTDIHFNLERNGKSRNPIRFRILEDIAKLNPEFIIFSGDIGLDPVNYDVDYPFGYDMFNKYINTPMYMVPGNHELTIDAAIDGLDYWKAMYGPRYSSFDYGPLHVVNLSTYDWAPRWRDKNNSEARSQKVDDMAYIGPEQWDWLQRDVAQAAGRGQHIIMHTHIPLEFLMGGKKAGLTKPEKLDGPSLQTFTRFLDHYKVSHVFIGHMHMNSERRLGKSITEVLSLAAGQNVDKKNPIWGYRIVHVKDGVITKMETREFVLKDYE